jgi:hypothetical protein
VAVTCFAWWVVLTDGVIRNPTSFPGFLVGCAGGGGVAPVTVTL